MKRKNTETLSKRELDLILGEGPGPSGSRYCVINHEGNVIFISRCCGEGSFSGGTYVVFDTFLVSSGVYTDKDMEKYLENIYREDVKMTDHHSIETALYFPNFMEDIYMEDPEGGGGAFLEDIDTDPEIKKERINKKMQEILENSDV